jgi:hypothetical protein
MGPQCSGLVVLCHCETYWEEESRRWEATAEEDAQGWGGVLGDETAWKSTPEKLFKTFYALSRGWPNRIWPRMNVEDMPVEVQSQVESSPEARPACRCCDF